MFSTRGSLIGRDPSGTQYVLHCSQGMERTVQVLAVHCVLKQSSDILASPGTMLAPALSTDREEQQQHILTPASAKAAPAQCHAHHCSICGAVRHTQACLHTRAHMCTHTHAHAYAQTHRHTRAHTYTRTNAQAHARAHTHTHTHAHSHTHAYACTR